MREHPALRESALPRSAATAREVLAEHIRGGVGHALAGGAIG
ncbi:hypothetical protein [Falsiroseomonas sp.]